MNCLRIANTSISGFRKSSIARPIRGVSTAWRRAGQNKLNLQTNHENQARNEKDNEDREHTQINAATKYEIAPGPDRGTIPRGEERCREHAGKADAS